MTTTTKGQTAYYAGMAAEDAVARFYAQSGMPEVRRRWRGKGGEIDLIFSDGDGLIFVEVKKSKSFDQAAQRVTGRQMARICCAAEEFLGSQPKGALTDVRFDIALVDKHGAVKVIENGFGTA